MDPGLIGLEVKDRGSIDGRHEEHAQAQHEDLKKMLRGPFLDVYGELIYVDNC